VTVLNGRIHKIIQKVEGGVTFHTAASKAFPQPASGTACPGPDEGGAGGELHAGDLHDLSVHGP
jgi:Icc protein